MTEPRTAAGRALLENPQDYPLGTGDSESPFLRAILAIEAEAANGSALDVERLHHALFLTGQQMPMVDVEYAAAEYARLSAARSAGEEASE